MDVIKDSYSITELSKELGLTDHALRYYEKEFEIPVPRDERGRRYYTAEHTNLLYQIKSMREEGLEIKAIKKILQSGNMLGDLSPIVQDNQNDSSVLAVRENIVMPERYYENINCFFEDLKMQINESISCEVKSIKEYFSEEIMKTKLELGACIENSARKIEYKLSEHFQEVDKAITNWRKRKKGSFLKRLFSVFR